MSEDKRKPAAPIPSVGADGEQPTSIDYNEIISGDFGEINLEAKLSDEEFDEIQAIISGQGFRRSRTPRSPTESPRYLAARMDESIIVGYYTLQKCPLSPFPF